MARQRVEETKYVDIQLVLKLDEGALYKCKLDRTHRRHFIVKKKDHFSIDTISVHLATTKTGFGFRQWFYCPVCIKKTKRLYLPENENVWACRACHQLTYTKSQLSGNEFAYLTYQIKELQALLQVNRENSYSYLGMTTAMIERVPLFKPRYMRQEKFDELTTRLELMILKRVEVLNTAYE